jgi:hypothetical protein
MEESLKACGFLAAGSQRSCLKKHADGVREPTPFLNPLTKKKKKKKKREKKIAPSPSSIWGVRMGAELWLWSTAIPLILILPYLARWARRQSDPLWKCENETKGRIGMGSAIPRRP